MDPKSSSSTSITNPTQNHQNARALRPDEINCRICKTDLKFASPKLLPCLHTLCAQCLQKTTEGGPSKHVTRCSICRHMFNTADVIDNYFINGANAVQTRPYEPKTCTGCEDNAKASWFCENCVEVLCDACKRAHQRVKLTKEHKVTLILQPTDPGTRTKRWFPPCPRHHGQVLWLFCTTCEILICQQCQSSQHSTHRAQVVDTTAQVVRQHYQGTCTAKLAEKCQQVRQVREQITKIKNEITHHEYEITGKMRSLMEKLVMEITNRIVTLNNSLKESTKKKHQFLDRQQLEVQHLERGITRCQEFIRGVVNSANDSAVVSCRKTLSNQVDFLLRREPTKMPIAGLELTFLLNDNCNILQQLGSLGHLIVRDPLERNIDKISQNISSGVPPAMAAGVTTNGQSPLSELTTQQQSELFKANLQKMSPAVRNVVANAMIRFDKHNQQAGVHLPGTNQPLNVTSPTNVPGTTSQLRHTSQIGPSPPPQVGSVVSPHVSVVSQGGAVSHSPSSRPVISQVQSVALPSRGVTLSVVQNSQNARALISPSNVGVGPVIHSQAVASTAKVQTMFPQPTFSQMEVRIPSITPNSVRSLNTGNEIMLHIPNIVDELPKVSSHVKSSENSVAVTSQSNSSSSSAGDGAETISIAVSSVEPLVTSSASSETSVAVTSTAPATTTSSTTTVTTTEAPKKPEEIKVKTEPGSATPDTSSKPQDAQPLVNTDVLADGKYRIWSGHLTWKEASDKSSSSSTNSVKCNFHDFHSEASTSVNVAAWPERFSMHLIPRHYIKSIEMHIKAAKKLFIEFDEREDNQEQKDKITAALLADMVGIACYFTGPTKIGVFIVACIRRLQKYVALVPAQQKEVLRTLRDVAGDKMRVYLQEIAKQQPKPVMPATTPDAVQSPSIPAMPSGDGAGVRVEAGGKPASIGSMLETVNAEYSNVPKKSNPDDPNEDWCAVCQNGGDLLCCDSCPRVFHLQCHIPPLISTPNDAVPWNCTFCRDITEVSEPGSPVIENGVSETAAVTEQSSDNPKKRKRDEHISERDRKLCERVLLELFCNQSSIPFREPVGEDVPGYHQIINHAIDMSTIKGRLVPDSSDYYHDVDEMLVDLKLMFNNCFAYNGVEASISQMAKGLQRHLNRLINQFLPDYGPEVDRNDPTWSTEERANKRKRRPKDILHIK